MKMMNQFFADITAGSEVFFDGGCYHTGSQGYSTGSKLAD